VSDLLAVDHLRIQILVDNASDGLSSVPAFVETEMAYLWRNGLASMKGQCLCCAAHGLSCLITASRGGVQRTLLFDTGPDAYIFERNVQRLKVDLTLVDAIVVSHGHWDHAGALETAIDLVCAGSASRRVPVHMHPDMFHQRAMRAPNGDMQPFEDIPSIAALTARGADVILERRAEILLDQLFHVSGEIERVTAFERGMPDQYRRSAGDVRWEPDPWVVDERSLEVLVHDRGLVIFTACSHAGVINVIRHARVRFPDAPLLCVLGGLHLSGANEEIIPHTIEALKQYAVAVIAPGHCTGWRAVNALASAFGEDVIAPLSVGKTFTFSAESKLPSKCQTR
jgi:7,8-dihydropterin-6-yl-methyl-4-(beta-D-ribofuranosyl)aminobenzene 5'-phosphate synthase